MLGALCTLWYRIELVVPLGTSQSSFGVVAVGGGVLIGYGRWDPEVQFRPQHQLSLERNEYAGAAGWYQVNFGRLRTYDPTSWRVQFPIFALSIPFLAWMVIGLPAKARMGPKECRHCGYPLLRRSLCPECGRTPDPQV